jgi:hypothetical protein
VVPEWMMTLLLHHQAKMKHKEHCLMGIRYLSSRRYDCEDFCFTDKNLSIAYVFPVTGVGGQAKRIEDSFRMTAPRSYFFYKIHRFDFGKRRARISDYDDSLFFQIEQQLKKEKLEEIRE